MAVEVAPDVARARRAPAACPPPPPRSRPCPRAARARCRPGRGACRRRPRSCSASTLPVSASLIPCSETERPTSTARSRSSMLCAAEPVKCWSRFPYSFGGTIRRSTLTPLWVTKWAPVAPGFPDCGHQRVLDEGRRQRLRVGGRRDQVDVLAGLGQAARRAGDLDRLRRRGARAAPRPAPRRSAAHARAAAAPAPPRRPSSRAEARMFSSAFGPRPLRLADPLLGDRGSRRSSRVATPSSS